VTVTSLGVELLPGGYCIAQVPPGHAYPPPAGRFWSVIRTPDETSIVCESEHRPPDAVVDDGWSLMRLQGPLPLTMTGVLVRLLAPLAEAGVEIYALATFNTDYVLVRTARVDDAVAALTGAGHRLTRLTAWPA
jgi:uncharacterized protein